MYPTPSSSMARLGKMATPATAVTVFIPNSAAPLAPVPGVIVSVTLPVKLVAVSPDESRAVTSTYGRIIAWAVVLLGCTVNTNWVAGPCARALPAARQEMARLKHHGRDPVDRIC
jgi:hypothetical protein